MGRAHGVRQGRQLLVRGLGEHGGAVGSLQAAQNTDPWKAKVSPSVSRDFACGSCGLLQQLSARPGSVLPVLCPSRDQVVGPSGS